MAGLNHQFYGPKLPILVNIWGHAIWFMCINIVFMLMITQHAFRNHTLILLAPTFTFHTILTCMHIVKLMHVTKTSSEYTKVANTYWSLISILKISPSSPLLKIQPLVSRDEDISKFSSRQNTASCIERWRYLQFLISWKYSLLYREIITIHY